MEIKSNVQAPPKNRFSGGVKSEEVQAIEDFLTSGNAKNMAFEYEDAKAAKRKTSTISSHLKRCKEQGKPLYDFYRVGNTIYIVRVVTKVKK